MKNIILPFLFSLVVLCSSCATMYTGSNSIIHFNSAPLNAKVFVDEKYVGNTPLSLKVEKNLIPQKVKITKDGYATSEFKLQKKFAPLSLLSTFNIWVDVISGAVMKFSKNYYHVELKNLDSNVISYAKPVSDFYYITSTGDTVFTAPFYKFKLNGLSSNVTHYKFKTVNDEEAIVRADDVKKIKSLKLVPTYKGLLTLTVQTNIDYRYDNFLCVPYYQSEKLNRSIIMEELLENEKFHLLKSYFDNNTVRKDGSFYSGTSPIYYLYEDGKKLVRIEKGNLLNVLVLNFKNEKELIRALKKKCTFKRLEKYIYENKDSRNMLGK